MELYTCLTRCPACSAERAVEVGHIEESQYVPSIVVCPVCEWTRNLEEEREEFIRRQVMEHHNIYKAELEWIALVRRPSPPAKRKVDGVA